MITIFVLLNKGGSRSMMVLKSPGCLTSANKDSVALGTGITLNFSIPLDRQYTKKCKEAAQIQNDINKQILKNKELDWHMARLRHCGEKKIAGIRFTKDSPYYDLCSDIEIVPKANQVLPHIHKIDVKE